MRKTPRMTYLWPGLPQLWQYGSWGGLAIAVVAACLLDLLLIAGFGWSELLSGNLRMALWAGLAVAWVAGIAWSAVQCRRQAALGNFGQGQDPFAKALDHYLQGDYYQTEQILDGLLRRNARDVEARLMLATMLRHLGRTDEAAKHLDMLSRFEGAARWELEIENERDLLEEAAAAPLEPAAA
jgi:hypothetical protein